MRNGKTIFITCCLIVAAVIVLWAVFTASVRYFSDDLAQENKATLQLVEAGLRGALKRYEPLPSFLADKDDILMLVSGENSSGDLESINLRLRTIAEETGVSDIYVMDAEGYTITASNFDQPRSFIGENFSYRPYFQQAMLGKKASYFALGTTSLKRGYYYSAPISNGASTIGVVAVKVTVDDIEDSWIGSSNIVVAADKYGIVFMSNLSSLLFKSLQPITSEAVSEIESSRQYPLEKISELDVRTIDRTIANASMLEIRLPEDEDADPTAFVSNSQYMPDIGWTLHVLRHRSDAVANAYVVVAFSLLGLILSGFVLGLILYRRKKLMESFRLQSRAREELELRVQERTNDLKQANESLELQVNERIQTEERLRQTQQELIQAGKLAALGQMSAALSHEMNQPLAAIRTYAENAMTFIKRGNYSQADDNIGQITKMSDRMAELGMHLRNFARKPKEAADIIDLFEVLEAVESIMQARLRTENAKLHFGFPQEKIFVKGGSVRLQQVFVNLVNNALDSMLGTDAPVVEIGVSANGPDRVFIDVRDFGSGINSGDKDRIFDPFFTTKQVNEGLGLGLSISYNVIQDFGGELKAANHPEGGAVFTVALVRAKPKSLAAE